MNSRGSRMRAGLILAVAVLLGSCSLFPPRRPGVPPPQVRQPAVPRQEDGAAIAGLAASLVGTPYHFGGADVGGFDCSGLALYVHERVGLSIPRTAAEQQQVAQPVPLAQLLPGDLVFFRIGGRGVDHVGIYGGSGRFIHAPHVGGAVGVAELSRGFYARHLVNAGRFWGSAAPSR